MSRYVDGIDFDNKTMDGVWLCPSNRQLGEATMITWNAAGAWADTTYQYFGRSDLWNGLGVANHPDDLVANKPESDRLMMNEVMFRWWVNQYWTYNHGDGGGSSSHQLAQGDIGHVPANFAGMNQMYGDGHAKWMNATPSRFALSSIQEGYVLT